MEVFKINALSFSYPERENAAVSDINLTVKKGEFLTLCGKSGCGKTTLLRLLKPSLSPHGERCGEILYEGESISSLDARRQSAEIGFVMQNPDSQIVTDKVYSEMAFGLESLGYTTNEIRTRVSEVAAFFGIEKWFYEKTENLSGGQKQLLSLASIMAMQPKVLILDEPTSQLDPIAASEFLRNIKRINEEFGTSIILAEHRLEEAFSLADRVVVMDGGRIIADDAPDRIGKLLAGGEWDMFDALPVPCRVFASLDDFDGELPITVSEGKGALSEYAKGKTIIRKEGETAGEKESFLTAKGVFFRYEKESADVIKNFEIEIKKGEIFTLLGGNGVGKSTMAAILSGLRTPQRGEVRIAGRKLSEIENLHGEVVGFLPQNPQSIFSKKSVYLNLLDMTSAGLSEAERKAKIESVARLCGIGNIMQSHPNDLSGGEQERLALSMVLLKNPRFLVLDEPTKGMDASFKKIFAEILCSLKNSGVTILMVSHDIEFAAEVSDRCALMFDGNITSSGSAKEFFSGNAFYTTSANKMAREIIPDACLASDVIFALGGTVKERPALQQIYDIKEDFPKQEKRKISKKQIVSGVLFALCFFLVQAIYFSDFITFCASSYVFQMLSFLFAALTLSSLLPQTEIKTEKTECKKAKVKTVLSLLLLAVMIPLTVLFGVYFMGGRKHYFISILIIFEVLASIFFAFERRRPQAREVVIISVLCALGVVGRSAFFMVPHFKPVVALVIITGVCFGGEVGFLVGAMTAFVSNFFFSQGPWTPWQMLAFGIIGFVSGLLFCSGLRKTKLSLSVFGFISTLVLYGVIMNIASVLTVYSHPTSEMLITALAAGVPVDLVHASSTAFFLWFISAPMIENLERIKKKYGLIKK